MDGRISDWWRRIGGTFGPYGAPVDLDQIVTMTPPELLLSRSHLVSRLLTAVTSPRMLGGGTLGLRSIGRPPT